MERIICLLCLIITSHCLTSCPSRWPPNGKLKRKENIDSLTEDPIFGLDPASGKRKDKEGENIWILQSYLPDHYFNGFLISVIDIGPKHCGNSTLASLNDQSKEWKGCNKVLRNTHTKIKSFMPFKWTPPKCGCSVLRATVIAKLHYYYLENEDVFDNPLAKTICKSECITGIQNEVNIKYKTERLSLKEFLTSVRDADDFPEDTNSIVRKIDISYITDPWSEENNQQDTQKTEKDSIQRNIINKITRSCLVLLEDKNNFTADEQKNHNVTCVKNLKDMRDCCLLSQMERFKCFVVLKNRHIDELCNNTLPACRWQWDSWNFQHGQHECCEQEGNQRYNCFNQTFWLHHKQAFDTFYPLPEITTTNDALSFSVTPSTEVADGEKNRVDDSGVLKSLVAKDEDNHVDEAGNQFNDEVAIRNIDIPPTQPDTPGTKNIDINQAKVTKSYAELHPESYRYCCQRGIDASSDIDILLFAFRKCQVMSEIFYRQNLDLVNYETECRLAYRNCCIRHSMRPNWKGSND